MTDPQLPFVVTSLATAIAADIPDDDELSLLALILTQLADTLSTIVAVRSMQQQKRTSKESPSPPGG